MYLLDAKEGIPLYLVEIEGEDLRNWLTQAGMEVGEPIWKSQKVDKKKIAQRQTDETALACVLTNKTGNMVTLPGNAMGKIIVRLCDICWACGLCR